MTFTKLQGQEWAKLARSRTNRKVCRIARESASRISFEQFIAFLDDAQLLGTTHLKQRPFVRYRIVPF